MSVSRALSVAPLVAVAALSSYGCEDNGVRTSIGPSSIAPDARFVSRAISVEPVIVHPLDVHDPQCPTRRQLLAPFDLFVRADGASGLSLHQVRMQFLDRRRVLGAARTFTRTELTSLFGSTLVPAFGSRRFPFSFPLGCAGLSAGTLDIVVFAADSFGRESSTSFQIGVR